MRTVKIFLIGLVTLLIFQSCEFSENCEYAGNLRLLIDDQFLPDGLNVTYFEVNIYNGESKKISILNDTLITGLKQGQYNVLAYNKTNDVYFKDTSIELPVYKYNNKTYTYPAPYLYVNARTVDLIAFETVICKLNPKMITKQVIFDFEILYNNTDKEVSEIKGELQNVCTEFNLNSFSALDQSAILPFSLTKKDNNTFNGTTFLLGFNEKRQVNLEFEITLSDLNIHSSKLDMSNIVNHWNENTLYCKLQINVNALGIELNIIDWKSVDDGKLILQ